MAIFSKKQNGERLATASSEAPAMHAISRTSTTQPPEYPTGVRLYSILVSLFLAVLCVSLDRTIIATAIPKITEEFKSIADIGWYGSAYLLTSAGFQLAFGRLFAEFNIKWLFILALVIFEVGSVICAAAPTSVAFIIGRAIAGIGSSGAAAGVFIILAHSVPLHLRPRYTGLIGAAAGISQAIGPTIGGAFAEHVSWRWCFWINLPVGGVTLPVVIVFLHLPKGISGRAPATANSAKKPGIMATLRRFDAFGTFFIFPSTVSLLLALSWAGTTYAWNSWRIILLLVVFALCFIAWIAVEIIEGDAATLPPRLLRQRSIAAGLLYMFLLTGYLFPLMYYLPIWFQAVRNVSPQQSGVDILAMSLATVLCALSAGFLTTAIGYYNPLMLACTLLASIGSGLIYRFDLDTSTGYWIGSLIVAGMGFGFGGQQSLMVPQTILHGRDIALGTSAMMFMMTMSGAIFLNVSQNLFTNHLVSELRQRAPNVNPQDVVSSGAYGIRETMGKLYSADDVQQIIASYMQALKQIFLLAVIMACLTILGSGTLEWRSIKKNKKRDMEAATGTKATAAAAASDGEEAGVPKTSTELTDLPSSRENTIVELEPAAVDEDEAGASERAKPDVDRRT